MDKTVLIVEDCRPQLAMLEKLVLEVNPEAKVFPVDDVDAAYAVMLKRTIDVFIIDIILDTAKPGDTSGIELAKRIREVEKYMLAPCDWSSDVCSSDLRFKLSGLCGKAFFSRRREGACEKGASSYNG